VSVVLDASALLAVLLDEPGSNLVFSVMRGSAMSAVNASESFSRVVDKGHSPDSVATLLREFEIDVIPFRLNEAAAAAALRSRTRSVGASLGDRACLALAIQRGQPVYTGDRRLAELDLGIEVRLIR